MSAAPTTSELASSPARHSFAASGCSGFRPYHEEASVVIYHGDCRQIVPMLGRFDLLLTDPPYGIGAHKMTLGNGRKKIYRGEQSWDESPPTWELDMVRAAAEKQIIWGGNYFGLPPARGWLFWDKGTGGNDYADGELAWTNLDMAVRRIKHLWSGFRKEQPEERYHPTQKPLRVIRWALEQAGETSSVLDPWMGSGTTLVAAKALGLRAVGIEANENYCRAAVARLAQDALPFHTQNKEADRPNL